MEVEEYAQEEKKGLAVTPESTMYISVFRAVKSQRGPLTLGGFVYEPNILLLAWSGA